MNLKLLLYQTVLECLKSTWEIIYLKPCAKTITAIFNSSWNATKRLVYNDIKIRTVYGTKQKRVRKYKNNLENHRNHR